MASHLFIVHFPLSLALAGALVDLLGTALGRPEIRRWGGHLFIAGAATTLLAFATGEGARIAMRGASPVDPHQLEAHAQWGSVGTWAVVVTGGLRVFWRDRLAGPHGWLNLALAVAGAALLMAITISGTLIRHGG